MSKKNKGKNAFYFFMLEWKKRQEATGRTFPEGIKDVQRDPKCSADWQNLNPQEKGYYNAKAKESKVQAQGCLRKKTALGESIEEVIAAEKREQEFQEKMHQYIDSIIAMGLKHKSLEKSKFIIIHVNWFYRRDIGINKYDFCPAEFAVAEFSLGNGIENIYHEILNVKIPLGFKRDAIEISQQTHRIPIELPEGQGDFALMYDKLADLLENHKIGDKFPPLFTIKDLAPAVDSFLRRMTDAVGASTNDFLIYSLEALFGALRNIAAQNANDCSIPLVVAENEFKKDVFSSVCDLECDFHKVIDSSSQYCSMSIIKRWGFTICDYCCEYLGIPMIEGVHYPVPQTIFNAGKEAVTEEDNLDAQLKCLGLNSQRKVIEMNGVTEDHRRKVSERSYKEELRRRNESKLVNIIDHGKSTSSNSAVLIGRPLRPPKTIPQAISSTKENTDYFNIADFPPLGGTNKATKRNESTIKLPLGRGRGST